MILKDADSYRLRVMVEYYCDHCGEGFSSTKTEPKFCSHECYVKHSKSRLSDQSKALWSDSNFRRKIQAARKSAGYPDANRPEAIAKRKLRTAVKNALRRCLKSDYGAFRLLGYSVNDLKSSIEAKFQEGMSWTNYGLWEIDHKFPVSKFPAGTPLSVINALENLQPLWKIDNRSKGNHVKL